jgi:hypothetical protein
VPIFARHVTAASPTVLRDTVGGLSSRTYGGEPLESVDLGQLKVSSGKKASYRRFTSPKVKNKHAISIEFYIWIVLKMIHCMYKFSELAIAEVGFEHPDHLSRAEKMQSLIESSLQHVLGCNVEIRFKLVPCPVSKDARLKRQPFSFLNCSGRKQEMSDSVVTDEDEAVRGPGARETPLKGYTSSQQESPYTMRRVDSKPTTVHGCEDDARSTLTSSRSTADDLTRTCRSETSYPKGVREQGRSDGAQQEPDLQPNCFSRTLKLQKKLLSSGAAHTICLRVQPHNKMDFLPKKEFGTYFCAYEPYEQCTRSDSRATYSSRDDDL